MTRFNSTKNNAGFTLIEMAMVMVIIGLLAGMAMPLMSMLIKQGKQAEERAGLSEAKQALIGAGITQGGFPTPLANNELPVSSLGVRTVNPYTKPLLYDVHDSLLASATGGNLATMCSNIEDILTATTGPFVWPGRDYSDPSVASQLAFVVISTGPNYHVDGENTPVGILGDRIYENSSTQVDGAYDDIVATYALTQLCTDCTNLGYHCVTVAPTPPPPSGPPPSGCTASGNLRCATLTNNTSVTLYWAIGNDTKNASPCNAILPGQTQDSTAHDKDDKIIVSPGLDSKDSTKCNHQARYVDDKLKDIDTNNDLLAKVVCNIAGKDMCQFQ